MLAIWTQVFIATKISFMKILFERSNKNKSSNTGSIKMYPSKKRTLILKMLSIALQFLQQLHHFLPFQN